MRCTRHPHPVSVISVCTEIAQSFLRSRGPTELYPQQLCTCRKLYKIAYVCDEQLCAHSYCVTWQKRDFSSVTSEVLRTTRCSLWEPSTFHMENTRWGFGQDWMYFAALNYRLDESSYFCVCVCLNSLVRAKGYFCVDSALKFPLMVRFCSDAGICLFK